MAVEEEIDEEKEERLVEELSSMIFHELLSSSLLLSLHIREWLDARYQRQSRKQSYQVLYLRIEGSTDLSTTI